MAKVQNIERLQRKFRAMPQVVRSEIGKAIEESAIELSEMQQRLAPKGRTGKLSKSNKYRITKGEEFRAVVFNDDPKAPLVEFGTKAHTAGGRFKGATIPAIPARPFFYPAYRALRKRIKSRVSRSITKGIKKVAGK